MARISGEAVRAVLVEAGARGDKRLARGVTAFLNEHGKALAEVIDRHRLCVQKVFDGEPEGRVVVVSADESDDVA